MVLDYRFRGRKPPRRLTHRVVGGLRHKPMLYKGLGRPPVGGLSGGLRAYLAAFLRPPMAGFPSCVLPNTYKTAALKAAKG